MRFPIETREQRGIIAACITLSILPIVAAGLRLLARHISNRKLDLSDYFMVVASAFMVGHWIEVLIACTNGGMGYMGLQELTEKYGPGPASVQYQVEFSSIFVVLGAGCFYKLSILLLYIKLLPFTLVHWLSRFIMVITLLWYFGTWITNIFIILPIKANWDLSVPVTHQGNINAFSRSIDAMTILTDILILGLPFPYLFTLHMAFRRKCAILSCFALGSLTIVVSVIRLYLNNWDRNYQNDLTVAFIFEGLEPSVGIVTGCVLTLRPLLGRSAYTSSGTAHARSSHRSVHGGLGYGTRALDELDKDSDSVMRLRPMGPEHSTRITSTARDSDSRGDGSDVSGENSRTTPLTPNAIVVRQNWEVASHVEDQVRLTP